MSKAWARFPLLSGTFVPCKPRHAPPALEETRCFVRSSHSRVHSSALLRLLTYRRLDEPGRRLGRPWNELWLHVDLGQPEVCSSSDHFTFRIAGKLCATFDVMTSKLSHTLATGCATMEPSQDSPSLLRHAEKPVAESSWV